MSIDAPRDAPLGDTAWPKEPKDPAQKYMNSDYLIQRSRSAFERNDFGSDAFPEVSADFGPGSLALYLGSEPTFEPDTVWYRPCIESLETTPLPKYDPENRWLRAHLDLFHKLRDVFGADAHLTIPDIIESTDILSAMRGPAAFLYDIMDRPEQCRRWLERINSLYQVHYDAFYDIAKDDMGGSVFTAFHIWGPARTVKVQCDFSAMISPDQFGEFFIPYVKKQIEGLDRVLFHLDGPNCIGHVDQLLKLERLHAIQWVSGAGAAPNDDERWHPLYEKIPQGRQGPSCVVACACGGGVRQALRRTGSLHPDIGQERARGKGADGAGQESVVSVRRQTDNAHRRTLGRFGGGAIRSEAGGLPLREAEKRARVIEQFAGINIKSCPRFGRVAARQISHLHRSSFLSLSST